jgi:oligo-1,6-glucosidase
MQEKWWKEEIMYQIYPRSFQDSDGDGIGDIRGIIQRLDYIASLGVDIIWLSPIYQSPNDDNGYDISNYYEIHPEFGTMEDFDELLSEMHKRGLRLIMDLVVNHSSDEHKWFKESRSSKDNPYRDYYIWRKGKDGGPPNNYMSFFSGSAWEYDEATKEYYLHYFTKKQPDLNWENPKVREEVYRNMRFWLDKGVDGFRMDVISLLSKNLDFPDSPSPNITYLATHYYANGPRIHEFLQEMHEKVLKDYDVMTVGEGPGITKELANDYIGYDRKELNMIFQLDLMFGDHGEGGKFDIDPMDLVKVKRILNEWEEAIGDRGWNNIFLDNHDFPRMVSRFGNDTSFRVRSAKMLNMFLLSMRGTPCIYQGSEIGMTNVAFDKIEDYRDVEIINWVNEERSKGQSDADLLPMIHIQGRDNEDTDALVLRRTCWIYQWRTMDKSQPKL